MLIKANDCSLILIDMQEKLLPLVIDSSVIIENCQWLLKIAEYLNIPLIITEQYPKGLGHTIRALNAFDHADNVYEKICFSAQGDAVIAEHIQQSAREQWILIGIETHVCVLQTALSLRSQGKEVFIVEDCTGSRSASDKRLALDRMKQHGISIVSREMVVFEWLMKAGTEQFKHINENFIK